MKRLLFIALLSVAAVASGADTPPKADSGPTLAARTLTFHPGAGRQTRQWLLYHLEGESLYFDSWDAVQALRATRYFDPITRKMTLGLGKRRVKFTDGSQWVLFDGRPRNLSSPCRIVGGHLYVPLVFWPVLLDEWPNLPLRLDETGLTIHGGRREVVVRSVEWVLTEERLRGIFSFSEAYEPGLEPVVAGSLRLRFPGCRLGADQWDDFPAAAPIDSISLDRSGQAPMLEIHFSRPVGEMRGFFDPVGRSWAVTIDLPESILLPEPDPDGQLPTVLPGGKEAGRRLKTVILDPGHGGADEGCVASGHYEKDWTLRLAAWLAPILEEQGFRVLWSRKDDVARDPSVRAQAANRAEGDFFLSLHFTRRGEGGARGCEIVFQDGEPTGSAAGFQRWETVQSRHHESSLEIAMSLERSLERLGDWEVISVRGEKSIILEGLDMPALMLEAGNLDSAAERAAWEDGPTRELRLRTLARALAWRAERWRKESRR